MMICNGVRTQITHFKFLPISPLIFATVQKFALDYFRDQQILTPPCEWGWVLVVPFLGKTFEVEDSPGMVWIVRLRLRERSGHSKIYKFYFILKSWPGLNTWYKCLSFLQEPRFYHWNLYRIEEYPLYCCFGSPPLNENDVLRRILEDSQYFLLDCHIYKYIQRHNSQPDRAE